MGEYCKDCLKNFYEVERILLCQNCFDKKIAQAKQKEAEEIYNWFWFEFGKSLMTLDDFKKIKSYLFKRKELQGVEQE